MSMDPKIGGMGNANPYGGVGLGDDTMSTEKVQKVVAKVVQGVMTKSHVTADNKVTQALANSLALSMGLAAAKLMSPADLALLLKTVQSKTEQSMIALSKNDIERIQHEQKDQAEVRLKNLMEQIEKANKAQKSGLFGQIFGWIAAAFMAIAGAIMIATGVGAAAGAALLVGGIAMMTAMALSTPGADGTSPMSKMVDGLAHLLASTGVLSKEAAQGIATGLIAAVFIAASAPAFIFAGPAGGIAVLGSLLPLLVTPDNLVKMGMNEDEAQKLSLGLTIGMAVASIAVTAGPALASAAGKIATNMAVLAERISEKAVSNLLNFAAKAEHAALAATKFLGPATDIAEKVAMNLSLRLQFALNTTRETLEAYGRIGSFVAQFGQALAMVGGGTAQAVGVEFTMELTKSRAEEKMLKAFMLALSDKFQAEKERLEEMVRKLMNFDPIVAMMQSTFEAAQFVERHS